jgi:predicted alpha/beta-hydrolase family hydrolase
LVLIGKSMGSRVGCHIADEVGARAVVCFGYPLVSVRGVLRDEVLLALRTPILFVSGDRDRLCPLDRLEAVRGRMSAPSTLHVVVGGDHSLALRKRDLKARGIDQGDSDAEAARAVRSFLGAHAV